MSVLDEGEWSASHPGRSKLGKEFHLCAPPPPFRLSHGEN
jgi:hypothetical protein